MSTAFCGPLAAQFEQFATLMRSTGARHATLLANIHRFDRFLAGAHPETTTLTKEIVGSWFASFAHLLPTSQKRYRSATFQVCKFLRRRDPGTAAPEDFEPLCRTNTFKPHIFSVEDICTMLRASRDLRVLTSDPLRPWSMELLIVLLYTAGLRISEAVMLQVRDYDCELGTLTIRETKFAKSRLAPLAASAKQVVDVYLRRRWEIGLRCEPEDPLRCCPSDHPPCIATAQAALAKLMRDCGLKPRQGRGPRAHDIRHSFAVHRVHDWYRQNQDVPALLPHLATFMGHRGLESTQQYLSLTPAVLHAASTRFEAYVSTGAAGAVKEIAS